MNSLRYTAALTFLLAQLGAQPLRAASELEPIDDQLLRAGQLFSLVIRTKDSVSQDETMVNDLSVDVQTLPDNAVLLDNLDGSRTFMWIPDVHDSGDHALIVYLKNTATLATTHKQSITLTIARSDEEFQRLMQERQALVQLQAEVAPPPGVFPSTVQQDKSINHSSAKTPIAERQAVPKSHYEVVAATQNDVEKIPSTITGRNPLAIVEEVTDKKPVTAVVAASAEIESDTVNMAVEPSIVMADELILTVGDYFEQIIKLDPPTSARHTLRLLNRPFALALIKYSDAAYALSWLPEPPDAGISIVILQVVDVEDGTILDSQRLKLVVREQ